MNPDLRTYVMCLIVVFLVNLFIDKRRGILLAGHTFLDSLTSFGFVMLLKIAFGI